MAFPPPLDGETGPVREGESDDARGARELQAMRQRSFQLSVSASATSTDASPIASIAIVRIGRERR